MRKTFFLFVLQIATCVVLTASAIAQTIETDQGVIVAQESTDKSQPTSFSRIIKKFEGWVGLPDSHLEDLAVVLEGLQDELARIQAQRSEAANALTKIAPLHENLPEPLEPPSPPVPSEPPEIPNVSPLPEKLKAEIDDGTSFDSLAGDSIGQPAPLPVLNSNAPDWLKKGLVLGDEHSFAISSTLLQDLHQCREDVRAKIMPEIRAYLDRHVLKFASADQLPQLTREYVEKYWVKKGQEFDNIQDRPSGTYHTLWIGLHISSDQLQKVREWERDSLRAQRSKKVGVLGGVGVFSIMLLSGGVGLLARREKAKLKG